MPYSKKTPTKFTEGGLSRHSRRLQQLRMEVAAEAARIIATEGQHNYRAAKIKAADRIGATERLALPSNIEVEDALRLYQGLYGGSAHIENLEFLRSLAVEAMHYLERYNPRLVGSVLDGTANDHSRITLHVFPDSIESLILHFLEFNIPFRQEQRQIRWHKGTHRTMPLVVFEWKDTVIELMVFDPIDLRQAPPSPIDGRPQRRAALSEVECLLSETAGAVPYAKPAFPGG